MNTTRPKCLSHGFSMVELLVVLAIISIMSAVAVTAIASLGKADGFNIAMSSVSLVLERARAYAMANNTYVFVGIEETDAAQTATDIQQTGGGHIGRVAIQAFASVDGTMNLASSNLVSINKLQILNNVDIPASLSQTSGALAGRPTTTPDFNMGASSFPVLSNASSITSRNYTFNKVIAFDSLGVVHVPAATPSSGYQYIEIDVQPTNGNVIPSKVSNVGVVEIDATTGAVTVYHS